MKINQNLNEISFNRSSLISKILIVKILLLLSVFIIFQQDGFAQESSNYVMYRNGMHSYNPGASGLFHKHRTSINAKYYPYTFYGSDIKSVSLFFDQKVAKLKGGIGFSYTYDVMDEFRFNHSFGMSYAYHFDMGNAGTLGAGVYFGMITCKLISLLDTSTIQPVFLPGLAYRYGNLDFGISIGLRHKDFALLEKDLNIFNYPTINIFSSYKFYMGPKFSLTPSVYAVFYPKTEADRYFGNKMLPNYNFSLTANFSERFWIGAAYIHNYVRGYYAQSHFLYWDGLHIFAGVDIKGKYTIGVSAVPKIYTEVYGNDSPRFLYSEFVIAYKLGNDKLEKN